METAKKGQKLEKGKVVTHSGKVNSLIPLRTRKQLKDLEKVGDDSGSWYELTRDCRESREGLWLPLDIGEGLSLRHQEWRTAV